MGTRRRRWRRNSVLAVGAVALLLLLGRGVGLWPSPGAPTPLPGPGPEVGMPPPGTTEPPADGPGTPDAVLAGAGAAPVVEGPAAPAPVPPPVAPAGEDRRRSLRAAVTGALQAHRLGEAQATLRRLAAEDEAGAELLRADFAAALATAVERLRADFAAGEALAARTRLWDLLADDDGTVRSGLAAAAAGWPEFSAALPAGYVPPAQPLPRGTAVRVPRRDGWRQAPVVDARGHEVTVRLQDDAGLTFPSFPVVEVVPVKPTATLCAELGLAAVHAGDGLLARAWLASGLALAGESLPPRLRELQELLR